jgi:pimeloyl-ACP methyl ester carboxylesterase
VDSAWFKLFVGESMKLPARVWKAIANGFMSVDYTKELSNINKPALILWGDRDIICPENGQKTLANGIKNARLIVYEGTGHALHWEEPERFARDIALFVQSFNMKVKM